jgi:hypothetical protein
MAQQITTWQKSSRSGNGGNCVEVAVGDGMDWFANA